jgi:hypothetical protein
MPPVSGKAEAMARARSLLLGMIEATLSGVLIHLRKNSQFAS